LNGIERIAEKRKQQIEEGYTGETDLGWPARRRIIAKIYEIPFENCTDKESRISFLEEVGALCAAEIDRLSHKKNKQGENE